MCAPLLQPVVTRITINLRGHHGLETPRCRPFALHSPQKRLDTFIARQELLDTCWPAQRPLQHWMTNAVCTGAPTCAAPSANRMQGPYLEVSQVVQADGSVPTS